MYIVCIIHRGRVLLAHEITTIPRFARPYVRYTVMVVTRNRRYLASKPLLLCIIQTISLSLLHLLLLYG